MIEKVVVFVVIYKSNDYARRIYSKGSQNTKRGSSKIVVILLLCVGGDVTVVARRMDATDHLMNHPCGVCCCEIIFSKAESGRVYAGARMTG